MVPVGRKSATWLVALEVVLHVLYHVQLTAPCLLLESDWTVARRLECSLSCCCKRRPWLMM